MEANKEEALTWCLISSSANPITGRGKSRGSQSEADYDGRVAEGDEGYLLSNLNSLTDKIILVNVLVYIDNPEFLHSNGEDLW